MNPGRISLQYITDKIVVKGLQRQPFVVINSI